MNLEAHAPPSKGATSRIGRGSLPSPDQCLQGRECYIDSIYVTIGACIVALLLSIWAGWKDHRRLEVSPSKGLGSNDEIAWGEAED